MWGAGLTDGFMLMYKDPPGLQVLVHSMPSFPLLRSSSTSSSFPMVWATSPNEAQACRIWTVTVRAKNLPRTVAEGTLCRCPVQDIRRKLTQDCAVITPMLQSAHIIATPSDVHEVLHTLGVVQMHPVAPPMLRAPMPPSSSSASFAQIRLGNNVQGY